MHPVKGKGRASSTSPSNATDNLQNSTHDFDSGSDLLSMLKPATNPFFRLPRELRDKIYQLLDSTPTTFRYGDLVLLATVGFPSSIEVSRSGLPLWIMSNRQMCREAVEVFGRTRTFMAIRIVRPGWAHSPPTHWQHSTLMRNPLVINQRVIQNIAVVRGYSVKSGLGDWRPSARFLNLLKHMKTNDVCLETRWFRWSFKSYWDNGDSWGLEGREWIGRFRKVKICVQYAEAPGSMSQEMLQLAGTWARRLVCEGGVMSVEDLGTVSEYAIDISMRSGAWWL